MTPLGLTHIGEPDVLVDGAPDRGPGAVREHEKPLRARLRDLTQTLATDRTEEFVLPGRDGLLWARYRRLGREEKIAALFPEAGGALVERNAGFLADAVDEVFARDGDEDVSLGDRDRPLRYEQELAEVLGFTVDREQNVVDEAGNVYGTGAVGAVLAAFAGYEEEMLEHAKQVEAWMSTITDAAEERALGEA